MFQNPYIHDEKLILAYIICQKSILMKWAYTQTPQSYWTLSIYGRYIFINMISYRSAWSIILSNNLDSSLLEDSASASSAAGSSPSLSSESNVVLKRIVAQLKKIIKYFDVRIITLKTLRFFWIKWSWKYVVS